MTEYELAELPYAKDALEPFIDAETMQIHHDKHHGGYVKKLNAALENHPELKERTPEELVSDLNSLPEDIQNAVKNNGGGHVNHTFFWPLLKPGVKPMGEAVDRIMGEFGSLDDFKEQFTKEALGRFGSGWAWLVMNSEGKLEVMSTPNQDSPLTQGKKPILGLDLWEHAYYLKYQNRRADYVEAFFSIINWEQVNENYKNAK